MTQTEQEKARLARNAYHREWRAKNREKVREIDARYWARRAEREEQPNAETVEAENPDHSC